MTDPLDIPHAGTTWRKQFEHALDIVRERPDDAAEIGKAMVAGYDQGGPASLRHYGETAIALADLFADRDTAADLRLYAQTRKLPEAEIPYEELEERRCELDAGGQKAGLRCRRPWMLSAYRKT